MLSGKVETDPAEGDIQPGGAAARGASRSWPLLRIKHVSGQQPVPPASGRAGPPTMPAIPAGDGVPERG